MGATGENVRRLTDFGFDPAWSPDGSEIACADENVPGATGRNIVPSKLWAIDVASGEKRLSTEGDAVEPSWSPHGHRIAFWSVTDVSGRMTAVRDIFTIPAEGGDAIPVTDDAHVDWNPIWSPDGRIVFNSDRTGNFEIWTMDGDGSNQQQLTFNDQGGELGFDGLAIWSPLCK